jgi:oxygen-dependent protoporphyrinogen oxidase
MELDAIILGAGPAGLAVGHAMQAQGAQVKVLEPSGRVGGSIRTIREDGWLVEVGPNTLQLDGEADLALLQGYGLETQLQEADAAAAKRYILSRGRLHGLTASPASLFKSDLLSFRGKLRLLGELVIPRGGFEGETIEGFASRRFGHEAAARLMDPVVSGVHAGDPARLVMANCFPRIHGLERSHRSVFLGLARKRGEPRRIVGFRDGMQALADAMAAPLRSADALRLGTMPTLIRRDARGWNVAWRDAEGRDDGARARRLIVTAPHWHWGSLPFDEGLRGLFHDWERTEAPPVAVVARGYDRSAVEHALDGFGFLIPGEERRRLLGCLFPSSALPGRAPAGKVLLACFIGGARQPKWGRLPDAELRQLVDEELGATLGVRGAPAKEWIQRWERAIPQYGVDQTRREAALAAAEAAQPGLHFHGAFRGGISLMQVIRGGDALGRTLARG